LRLYLTGFMGAGKTTVGHLLAQRLAVDFVDLDARIEAHRGQPITAIFEGEGEAGFRRLETECLRLTVELRDSVVATGGGTPVDLANRDWMRRHGRIVWLDVPFSELVARLAVDGSRPLFRDVAAAEQLFASRSEAYGDCDLRIDAGELEPGEIVSAIVEKLEPAIG